MTCSSWRSRRNLCVELKPRSFYLNPLVQASIESALCVASAVVGAVWAHREPQGGRGGDRRGRRGGEGDRPGDT